MLQGEVKELPSPPSREKVAELLAKAEHERLVSKGNIVNHFFSAEEEHMLAGADPLRSACLRMNVGTLSSAASLEVADNELDQLETIGRYLDFTSDADLIRGVIGLFDTDIDIDATFSRGDCCRAPAEGVRYVDDSYVFRSTGGSTPPSNPSLVGNLYASATTAAPVSNEGVPDDGEGLGNCHSWSPWRSDEIVEIASTVAAVARSLYCKATASPQTEQILSRSYSNLNGQGASCDPTRWRPCHDFLRRPKYKLERIAFIAQCCCNLGPSKWPSNGVHTNSLSAALALDVLPQIAIMLQAQAPTTSCPKQAIEQDDTLGLYRRNTRAAVRKSHYVQKSFMRISNLLQIPENSLQKLLLVLPVRPSL